MINERRWTGLLKSVKAVRPSISSLTDVLADQTAWNEQAIKISVIPFSLRNLMSSPKVMKGRKTKSKMAIPTNAIKNKGRGWESSLLAVAMAIADALGAMACIKKNNKPKTTTNNPASRNVEA